VLAASLPPRPTTRDLTKYLSAQLRLITILRVLEPQKFTLIPY
jgi:hypothetical protein